jgi:flagellar basal body-associated protein FliL
MEEGQDLETSNGTAFEDQVETKARTFASAGASRLHGGANRDARFEDGAVTIPSGDTRAVAHPLPANESSFLPPSVVATTEAQSVTPPLVEEVQAIHISSTILRDEQIQDLEERLAESEKATAALLRAKEADTKRKRRILAVLLCFALMVGGGVSVWHFGVSPEFGDSAPSNSTMAAAPVEAPVAASVVVPVASPIAVPPSAAPSVAPVAAPSGTPMMMTTTTMGDNDHNSTGVDMTNTTTTSTIEYADDSMIRGQQVVLVKSCKFGPHLNSFQWQSNYTRMSLCGQEKETTWPIGVWYKIEILALLRPPGLTIWLDGVPTKLTLWSPGGDECLSLGGEFAYPDRNLTWTPSASSSDVDAGLDAPRPVYLQISPLDAHGQGVFSITINSLDPSCLIQERHQVGDVPVPQLPAISRSSSPAVASSTIAPTTTSPGPTTTSVPRYERPTASPILTDTTMMMGNNEIMTTPLSNQSYTATDGISGKKGSIILVAFVFFLVATLVAVSGLVVCSYRSRWQQQQQQQTTHQRDNDNNQCNDPLERSTAPPLQFFIDVNG